MGKYKMVFSTTNIMVSIITLSFIIYMYYNDNNIVCSILLFILGFYLFISYKKMIGYYTNMIGIYSLVWFSTIGLATLQLHPMQVQWKFETWMCLSLAYLFFSIGYSLKKTKNKNTDNQRILSKKDLFIYTNVILWLPIIFLVLEIILNHGMIPMFSENMSSYMNFGNTKLHFITVSCCFGLPVTYIYLHFFKTSLNEKIYLFFLNVINLGIPFLIVSRQLIIISVVMTAFMLCMLNLKREKKFLISAAILILAVWMVVSLFRNQDETYLKEVLYMEEDSALSVKNMQIYMYISMNYDNFNTNVGNIYEYTHGVYSIYPFFGLTGLKKLFSNFDYERLSSITERIIPVYNTYPIVMTPYMDGGVAGVIIYMFIIGIICSIADGYDIRKVNSCLINIAVKCCITFSFFTSWFSNQTWWFYLIYLTILSAILLKKKFLPNNREDYVKEVKEDGK